MEGREKHGDMLSIRLRQQEVVADLGLTALSGATLRELMDEAIGSLKDVLDVEYTKVLELLPGGKEVILRAGKGWSNNVQIDKSTVDTGPNSQAGFTLLSKEPVVVEDLRTEKRFSGPPLLKDHNVISGMSCVIWGKGRQPYGVLGIHTTRKRIFARHDVNFLQSIANILAADIQRQEDERRLHESEIRKAAILESSRDAIITIDHHGVIVEWNASAERLFGYSRKDVIGEHMTEFIIPPRLREAHERGLSHYLATGEGPVLGKLLEMPAMRSDGSEFISELTITRVLIEDNPPMFSATMRDITDRKEAEAALLESEERFRMLADNIPNLCWMANADGWIYWYNSRWYEYTGATKEEMEGWGWQSLHDPDVLPFVTEKWRASIQNTEPFEMVFPLKGADGRFRPFLTRIVPVRNEEKNTLLWFGTNTDITAIREVKEKLKYQNSLLEAIHKVSPLAIAVVSTDGGLEVFNERFAEMWGFPVKTSASELDKVFYKSVKKNISDPKGFIDKLQDCYKKLKENNEKIQFFDGRIYARYGSPVNGETGANYGYVWFYQDVTDRENIDKQKDEFIEIASHELKTPLTSIKGSIQVIEHLLETGLYNDLKSFVSKAHLHIDKLSVLISDLLDVSRIQAGKIEYNFSWFKVREIIEDSVEQISVQFHKHRITVQGDLDVAIYADKVRLEQVVINLIANAVKYSPGADEVIINVLRKGEELQVLVTDFGIGINKEDLPNLFNRFYRAKQSSHHFNGIGLGLYISREIIERHGGTIRAESEGKSKGSVFSFLLPVNPKME